MESKHIILEGVCKHFSSPSGHLYDVLKNIHMKVSHGERISIQGPSGSGKTTLLNLLGTLDTPSLGKIFLESRDLCLLTEKELNFIRNKHIGFIFQSHHLIPSLNALENVLLPLLAFKNSVDNLNEKKAKNILENVGLKRQINTSVSHLSGGEQLRVAIARSLINNPKLLLADEPTGSLDQESSLQVAKLLLDLNLKYGSTLIVVTHSTEVAHLFDQQLKLENAKLTPLEINEYS